MKELNKLEIALESAYIAYINACDYKRDHYNIYIAARAAYDVALEAADEE